MRLWTAVLAMALLGGCMTMGKEISEEQLGNLKRGETTMAQAIEKLGQPTSSTTSASGMRTMSYVFAHAQARPASFVPIIGPLVGGADSRSSNVLLIFGVDGKLLDYHAGRSNIGAGSGFAAGAYQAPIADQPKEAKPQ